jgi:hypothetical protein
MSYKYFFKELIEHLVGLGPPKISTVFTQEDAHKKIFGEDKWPDLDRFNQLMRHNTDSMKDE